MRLEPFSEDHVDAVAAMLDDPDVLRFTRVPDAPPPGFARDWLGRYEEGRVNGTREAFAALGDDGTFLGLALAAGIDREAREAELGYVVTPAQRGRGAAVAMLRALTSWAFGTGLERVTLIIDVDNPASLRVAARAGYTREGVLRSTYFKAGRRIDAELWSRLPSDPDGGDDLGPMAR